jgi:hypothetical protein
VRQPLTPCREGKMEVRRGCERDERWRGGVASCTRACTHATKGGTHGTERACVNRGAGHHSRPHHLLQLAHAPGLQVVRNRNTKGGDILVVGGAKDLEALVVEVKAGGSVPSGPPNTKGALRRVNGVTCAKRSRTHKHTQTHTNTHTTS